MWLFLGILFWICGGSVLAHSLCGHCSGHPVLERTEKATCCGHSEADTSEEDCYCEYAYFAFDAERVWAKNTLSTAVQASDIAVIERSSDRFFPTVPELETLRRIPPLLPCGGRHLLSMHAILII